MAKRLQLRRGTATEHSSFTGAIGELTYDTTNKKLKIHDGSTVGGLDVGSSISITRSITSGTKIADITIDGTTSSLYYTDSDTKVQTVALTEPSSLTWYRPTFGGTSATTGTLNIDGNFAVGFKIGTTSAVGESRLQLGNSTASGTANNSRGYLRLYSQTAYYVDLAAHTSLAGNRTLLQLPKVTNNTSILAAIPSATAVGSDSEPVYVTSDGIVTKCTSLSTGIPLTGARGSLAGYETVGSATTINATCADCSEVSSNITVSNGTSGTAWTKIVRVTAAVTVTLGSNWKWAGNEAPTITAGGIFLFCWCGSAGIANFMPNS